MIIKNLCGYFITICSQCDDLVDREDKRCHKCGHSFIKIMNEEIESPIIKTEIEDIK